MKKTILLIMIVFIAGWCMNGAYSQIYDNNVNAQAYTGLNNNPPMNTSARGIMNTAASFFTEPPERISPFDHIKENQIHVLQNKIIIDLQDAEWARFTDTNSMDPVIDAESNAIEFIPISTDQIHVGDIVSYKSEYASGTIIHRVIEIREDKDGWYCRMKGDNNRMVDPGKIRFEQIQRVVVGIIY